MIKFILIAVVISISQVVSAQKGASVPKVRELMELSGSGKLGVQVMNQMVSSFKNQLTEVPASFWDEFMKEVTGEELVELVVPIYAKHFTDAEIDELIKFYKTPVGRKLIEKLPFITQESYAVGEAWGQKLGEKVIGRLKEKGYLKDDQ
ncbi:DUF2059 domain-containing protein [Flavihumibacter stibioxidans]|nr:DUF2059 domain-containing protein [Flavihumibacter stibioxidans]